MTDPQRTYRVSELDGCEVVTEAGEVLGLLKDVYPTGSNDVFVVRRADPAAGPGGEREYLIPARHEVVLEIDLAARRIRVRMPPGLKEIYES